MCSCDDGYETKVYRERDRTARKPHGCVECRRQIVAGERYRYASGVFEGHGFSYAFCSDCAALKDEWSALAREYRLCGPCWEFGDMHETIFIWVEEAEFELADRARSEARFRGTTTPIGAHA